MKIEPTVFDGLESISIETPGFRLIVVTEIGPRIAWFSKPDEPNLLYWDKNGMERNGWKLYGGHRIWITRPMADESEDTYLPDNDPCAVTPLSDGVDVCAPASPVNHMARGMVVRVLSDTSVEVRGYLRNEGALIYSGGCWTPTCVVADKCMEIPLGSACENATWDVVYMAIPRIFAGNSTVLEDDQVEWSGNTLVLTPRGRTCKRVVRAEQGVIRLICDGYRFEKSAAFDPRAAYPFHGCNMAAFIGPDNFMAEMETYGEEQPIHPGQTIDHAEVWSLV